MPAEGVVRIALVIRISLLLLEVWSCPVDIVTLLQMVVELISIDVVVAAALMIVVLLLGDPSRPSRVERIEGLSLVVVVVGPIT